MTIKYEEIEKAVKILNLPEEATLKQIKERYRQLIAKWHPDKCKKDLKKCIEMSQKIIEAYEIIMAYCSQYKYSFKPEDIKRKREKGYDELWTEQFGNDPIWGCPKKEK